MKFTLFALTVSAFVFVLPTQAAPSSATLRWEKNYFPAVQKKFCQSGTGIASSGAMVKLFKISPTACLRTFRYAAKHCRRAAHKLPFYKVKNRTTAVIWGKWIGSCVGTAFDMKYTHKLRIP